MSHARCFTLHGRGRASICLIGDPPDPLWGREECEGLLLREIPCEEASGLIEFVEENVFRVKSPILVLVNDKYMLARESCRLRAFTVEAKQLFLTVREGEELEEGSTVGYWRSSKGVIRRVRSPLSGTLFLILWDPTARPQRYTFLVDTEGEVVKGCLKKKSTS